MSSNNIPETFRTFLTRQSRNFECSCDKTYWVDLTHFDTERSHFLHPEINSWTLTLWVVFAVWSRKCVCAFDRLLFLDTFWNLSYGSATSWKVSVCACSCVKGEFWVSKSSQNYRFSVCQKVWWEKKTILSTRSSERGVMIQNGGPWW